MTGDGASRLYELRLPGLADARQRDGVAAALARRLPGGAAAPGPGPGRTASVMRLSLGDTEAAALLRDLYATGIAPAAVVLRPIGAAASTAAPNPAFESFERRDGAFVPTWSWGAFVFGPLWYFRRGLYAKGTVLLVLSVCPIWTLTVTLLVSVAVLAYCGIAGNWDDYLLKAKGTQWW